MKDEHRQPSRTPTVQQRSRSATVNRRLQTALSWVLDRYDVPPFVGKLHWELGKAYCRCRIRTAGGEMVVQLADETVRFGLSTPAEYRRAKRLGGERAMIESLVSELNGTETVWDVGACVGTYSCFVASALTTGCVVGFEPESTNRARLRMNLETNADTERWVVSPIALSDENGTGVLSSEYVEAGGGHHHLTTETSSTANEPSSSVETKRGDTVVERGDIPAPDLLKIDVQGAERAVLNGLGGLLEDIDSIYLEVHPEQCGRYGTTAEDVEQTLRNAGYSLAHLGTPTNRRSGVYFIHGRK